MLSFLNCCGGVEISSAIIKAMAYCNQAAIWSVKKNTSSPIGIVPSVHAVILSCTCHRGSLTSGEVMSCCRDPSLSRSSGLGSRHPRRQGKVLLKCHSCFPRACFLYHRALRLLCALRRYAFMSQSGRLPTTAAIAECTQ